MRDCRVVICQASIFAYYIAHRGICARVGDNARTHVLWFGLVLFVCPLPVIACSFKSCGALVVDYSWRCRGRLIVLIYIPLSLVRNARLIDEHISVSYGPLKISRVQTHCSYCGANWLLVLFIAP